MSNEALELKDKNQALAVAAFEADSEQFQPEFSREDLAIPFLQVLQGLSPAAQEGGPAYIDGARPGMLYDTVTKELFNGRDGLIIVPAYQQRMFIEWKTRDAGGGFVRAYSALEGEELRKHTTKDDKKRDILENGHQLVETQQYSILRVDSEGEAHPYMFSLVSTQLKKARQWNSTMSGLKRERKDGTKYTPPMFAMAYKVTTVFESNDQGSWYGVIISPFQYLDEMENGINVYNAAKALRSSLEKGDISVEKSAQAGGDNIPF